MTHPSTWSHMLYWSHRSFRRPNLSVCPAPGVPGGKHTNYLNMFQHLVIQFNFKLFLSPVVHQMLFSVSLLYLHWQLRVKEASLLLCPLWLVSPAVQHPGIKTNRAHMNILKMSEGVLWQRFSLKSSYHLMLGSKNSVAWDCAQTWERQAELMRQKQTVKIIFFEKQSVSASVIPKSIRLWPHTC